MVQAMSSDWVMDHGGDPANLRRRLRGILPLATSLVLHAVVIAIGLLTARAIKVAKGPAPVELQSAAAVTDFDEMAITDALKSMALVGEADPTRPAAQDQVQDVARGRWAKVEGASRLPTLDGGEPGSYADPLIAMSATPNLNGRRIGVGNGPGGPGGAGGPLLPFGAPGGGGGGSVVFPTPKVRTVAYVCDASGSMIQTFTSLKAELTKAVTGLKAVQGFNILFFRDDKARSLAGDGMLLATPENKRKAFTFLEDTATTGTTNPIPAIEAAFRSKPQLVFLLTDADFPDNAAVLGAIRRLNAGKQTKVNTIAFTSGDASDELSQGFVELMKSIAQENGGTFKLVKENEL